jgi:hypothetical protein
VQPQQQGEEGEAEGYAPPADFAQAETGALGEQRGERQERRARREPLPVRSQLPALLGVLRAGADEREEGDAAEQDQAGSIPVEQSEMFSLENPR